jgi:hypothetical protein
VGRSLSKNALTSQKLGHILMSQGKLVTRPGSGGATLPMNRKGFCPDRNGCSYRGPFLTEKFKKNGHN